MLDLRLLCPMLMAMFAVAVAIAAADVAAGIIIVNFYAKYVLLYGRKTHAEHERRQHRRPTASTGGSRQKMAPFRAAAVTWHRLSYPKMVKHTPSYNIIKAVPILPRLPHLTASPSPPICHQMQMKSRSTVVALWRRLLIYPPPPLPSLSASLDKLNNLKQMQL